MVELKPITVRTYGTLGRTVIVLHGGPGAPGSVASLARELADGFHVLEPLQRRSGTVPLTVAQHVADLAAVARTPATLVGWSWGAMLALSFAARHPGRVRAIALIGCGTYDEASRAAFRHTMDERLGQEGRARLDQLRRRLAGESDPEQCRDLFSRMGTLAGSAQAWEPMVADENLLGPDPRGYEETWRDALRLQREGTEPAAFARIRVPVVMLHGNQDPHPGPATRDVLRQFMPHLEYVSFEACGHEPWRERRARARFLAELRAWLRAAGATRSGPPSDDRPS